MDTFITNSRGDMTIVKEELVGYELAEAIGQEWAVLFLHMAGENRIAFETASTNEGLQILTDRFVKLFKGNAAEQSYHVHIYNVASYQEKDIIASSEKKAREKAVMYGEATPLRSMLWREPDCKVICLSFPNKPAI